MEEIIGFDPKDIEENKILAAIGYLGILVLIPLFAKKDSKFVMEHARQGLAPFTTEIIVWLVELIPGRIPGFGFVIAILANICYAVLAIVSIIALVYVLTGKCRKIPIVYDFAKGLKI